MLYLKEYSLSAVETEYTEGTTDNRKVGTALPVQESPVQLDTVGVERVIRLFLVFAFCIHNICVRM